MTELYPLLPTTLVHLYICTTSIVLHAKNSLFSLRMLVRLTIRTPTTGGKDLELECQMEWSVRRVKEEIQQKYVLY